MLLTLGNEQTKELSQVPSMETEQGLCKQKITVFREVAAYHVAAQFESERCKWDVV